MRAARPATTGSTSDAPSETDRPLPSQVGMLGALALVSVREARSVGKGNDGGAEPLVVLSHRSEDSDAMLGVARHTLRSEESYPFRFPTKRDLLAGAVLADHSGRGSGLGSSDRFGSRQADRSGILVLLLLFVLLTA